MQLQPRNDPYVHGTAREHVPRQLAKIPRWWISSRAKVGIPCSKVMPDHLRPKQSCRASKERQCHDRMTGQLSLPQSPPSARQIQTVPSSARLARVLTLSRGLLPAVRHRHRRRPPLPAPGGAGRRRPSRDAVLDGAAHRAAGAAPGRQPALHVPARAGPVGTAAAA